MSLPELKQRNEVSWMSKAMDVLKPGLILYGFCAGYFGRDSYSDKTIKRVKMVNPEYGESYLHVEIEEDGVLDYAQFRSLPEVATVIRASNSWLEEQEEQDREWEERNVKS